MSSIAGNTSTTAVLAVGGIANSSITAAGDADWFKVALVAGRTYSFTVASSGGPGIGLPDPELAFYDSLGNLLDSVTNYSSGVATIVFRPTVSGNYFVGVNDNGGDLGNFQLSWVATDSIIDNVATAANLVANGSVSSSIDVSYDHDWFGLNMTAGLSYGFEIKSNGVAGLPDADYVLRDGLGNALTSATNYSYSINSFSFAATESGQYYLDISDNGGTDTGGYAVRWITTDTIQNNITTTAALATNAQVVSSIDVAGDSDWFKVSLTAGRNYAFEVSVNGISGLPDGDLQLRDAAGNVVANLANYSYATGTLDFTALTTGNYFISVNDSSTDAGGYTLRNVGADTVISNASTSSTLLDGRKIAGVIDNQADRDWHKFNAEQGQTYSFTLSGDGTASELAQVKLILRDAAGNVISSSYDTNVTLTFTATTDGPLFLDVQGQNGTYTGRYYLSVVSDALTLNGTAAAERITGGLGNTVINGLAGNDYLDGGAGADKLYGGDGNDTLSGAADNDLIYGGAGNDSLSGGSGLDMLEGGAGNDILRGGLSADTFLFRTTSNSDTVMDFQDGADKIRIIGGPTAISGLTITQVGDDVTVTFGTTSIYLESMTKAELTAADFLFV